MKVDNEKRKTAMSPVAFRATLLNILGNTALFVLKLIAGLLSGSIALISDAINSFNDIVASIATFICVRISNKKADEGHPFGHSRAEPVAGIIIAILAGILGFEILRESVKRFFTGAVPEIGLFALSVPLITIIVKAAMAAYFRNVGRSINSPALRATALDSFMDVFVSGTVLLGIAGAKLGFPMLDPLAGVLISVWVVYTGYRIGIENIDYLMGKAPEPWLMREIKEKTLNVEGVQAVNTVRAHYVGNFIHVEIHIEVDKNLSTLDSHAIGEEVERKVGEIRAIDKSFVHVDPV
ncbi:MAG: cation diffusion facilitator family transporter [Thermodesulfobacteriota bacterium]|nr:MAG: cation diffusion facilitator family transporter [Thermodesulfobacteriota bacterium]